MRRRNGSGSVFTTMLTIIFLAQGVCAQTSSIVLNFDFQKPRIVKNVFTYENKSYDSVQVESLNRHGSPGQPIMPFKTAKILLPQDRDLQSIEVIGGKKITLDGTYRINYGKTPVPLSMAPRSSSSNLNLETEPIQQIYSASTPFPEKCYRALPLQNLRGYKILVLNLYPVQYIPKEGLISYFAGMTVKVHLKPALKVSPLFRNLPGDKEKTIQMVDNPGAANSYTEIPERSHEGCIADPCDSYDYVIITSNELKNSEGTYTFEDLIDSKNQKGVAATIVTVEEIIADSDYDCDGMYGDGCSGELFNDKAAHIRNFIKDAYQNWGTEYVLLGGDGDGVDVGGESGDDIIPVRILYAFGYDGGNHDKIPADLYYAALDGNWNNDEDDYWGEDGEEDLYAEVYVGRAPVDSEEELSNFVMKTLAYEGSHESYLEEVWMVGEYLGDSTWGGDYKDEIPNGSSAHGYTTVGFPEYYNVNTLYDRDGYWPTSEMISVINNGAHIINHLGHAGILYVMKLCNAPFYQAGPFCGTTGDTDVDDLTNTNYCFIYSQGCYPGAFDNWDGVYTKSDSIAEHFVTSEHGAFAVIMNSRYGWYKVGSTDGPSQHYDRQFWDAIFAEGITNIGKANQDSKEDNIGFLDGYGGDNMKWCYYSLNLLGDPELEIWTKPEAALTINDGIEPGSCALPEDFIEYEIWYTNPVTEPNRRGYIGTINDANVIDHLPFEGVDFVSADPNTGEYDPNERTYTWNIGQLSPGEQGSLFLVVQVAETIEPLSEIINKVELKGDISYTWTTEKTPVCCYGGKVIYVDAGVVDPNDGSSWNEAFDRLGDALDASSICDDIWVAEGTYKPTTNPNNHKAKFSIPRGRWVYGGFLGGEQERYKRDWSANETVLDGVLDSAENEPNCVDYVVVSDANNVLGILDGFTIRGGGVAGVYCENSSLVVQHNKITDNDVGIYCEQSGQPIVTTNLVFQNEYGIYCEGTEEPIFKSNFIYRNLYGLYFDDTSDAAIVRNNTVANNNQMGIYQEDGAQPRISNCIFLGNLGGDLDNNYTAIYSYFDGGDMGLGNIKSDPNNPPFVNGADDDYHLKTDSVCVDAGKPNVSYSGERDIDDQFRLLDGDNDDNTVVDMGADEYCDPNEANPADFNEDGIVDTADLIELAEVWLIDSDDPGWNNKYDLYADKIIDYIDFAYFAQDWLWFACWKTSDIHIEMMMDTGGYGYSASTSMGQTQEEKLTETQQSYSEPSVEEQIEQIKYFLDWLDEIKDQIEEEIWLNLITSLEEMLKELEPD